MNAAGTTSAATVRLTDPTGTPELRDDVIRIRTMGHNEETPVAGETTTTDDVVDVVKRSTAATVLILAVAAAAALIAWRPLAADGWGLVEEGHPTSPATDHPVSVALFEAHAAVNDAIWDTDPTVPALRVACDHLTQAHALATEPAAPFDARFRFDLDNARSHACEHPNPSLIKVHDAVESLELKVADTIG